MNIASQHPRKYPKLCYLWACWKLTTNISNSLQKVAKFEHCTGLFHAIVASTVNSEPVLSVKYHSELLGIDRRVLPEAIRLQLSYKLLQPTKIKRFRISRDLQSVISTWITQVTHPTTNTNATKKVTIGSDTVVYPIYYRTQSIGKLFNQFLDDNSSISISYSTFYRNLPTYLKMEPKRTELCEKHSLAYEAFSQLFHF